MSRLSLFIIYIRVRAVFYGLAADRQEYCFTKVFLNYLFFYFFKVYF